MLMGIDAYCRYVDRRPAPRAVPCSDLLATTIRIALDARKLGLSAERTEELMLRAGAGIDVVEHRGPGQS